MPSLEEIAENSAAVAIAELLEPEDVESRRMRASEIADRSGYEPGQISRAWKEADLGGYDVDIQRLGRDGQTLIWEVSYDADSDSLPSCPPDEEVSGRERIWTRFRERLGDYGATLQDRGVLDPDFTEVYLDVVERIRKDEQEEVKLLNRVADHELVRERYDSVGERFQDASRRINELKDGVKEVREEERSRDGVVKTFLTLE